MDLFKHRQPVAAVDGILFVLLNTNALFGKAKSIKYFVI
ncbi:hypothetical protein CSC00_4258 [Klebsiella pneumoniae]|jgi:hypothetical protein|nr:hypothetical protein CSC00_4258 [Klebsiella pneumoniae]